MNNRGFTLMEMMFVVAIMTIVMGTLVGLAFSFGDMARLQNIQANTNDEARRAVMVATPRIRQAQRMSINWDALPGPVLTFRMPADVDGNGTPVNVTGNLEVGAVVTISRDVNDANGDGITNSQLIMTQGNDSRVLANMLSEDNEGVGDDGIFNEPDDVNGNGRRDAGIWFEPWRNGLRMSLQITGTDRRGRLYRTDYEEIILPRN